MAVINPNELSNEEYWAYLKRMEAEAQAAANARIMQQSPPAPGRPMQMSINGWTVTAPNAQYSATMPNAFQMIARYLNNGGFNEQELTPQEQAALADFIQTNGRISIQSPWQAAPQPRPRPVTQPMPQQQTGGFVGPTAPLYYPQNRGLTMSGEIEPDPTQTMPTVPMPGDLGMYGGYIS